MQTKPPSSDNPAELRRRAEAQLREQKKLKAGVAKTGADSRRLLHELQVHEIELEMQNAELRRARDELEASLENYTDLYDFAPVGYFTLTAAGVINQVNLTGTNLVGMERSRLVGRSFGMLVVPELRPIFHGFLKKVFTSQAKTSIDLELLGQSGRPRRDVNLEARHLSNGQECRVVVIDITERRQVAQELAEKARLLDLSHDGIIVRDMAGHIRYWNHGAEELYGWSNKEALGKLSHLLLKTKFPIPLKQMIAELHRTDRWIGELLHTKRDGRRITVLARKTLDRDRQGHPASVLEILTDITARKQAEADQRRLEVMTASNRKLELEIIRRKTLEHALKTSEQQLRQLSHEILLAQEAERKRISRELHDTVLQTLVSISVHLTSLTPKPSDDPASLRRKIVQTQRLVEKSLAMVHRFAVELRPTVLDDLGLIPALHTFLKDFMKRTGVRARLTAYSAVNQLPIAQSAVLYRVALEALNNVAIHAQASAVEVEIKKLPDWICLTITDDGKAFDVKRVLRTKGNGRLGLLGMRERLEMVGGKFLIKSTPSQGTAVTARIPVTTEGAGKNRKRSLETKP
jgi:PAS domain S-box-containing protein